MASWEDVRRIALALPETSEGTSWGNVSWRVREKLFVWERPLRPGDLASFGSRPPHAAPDGPILGARVEHVGAKEALLADDPEVYFTTPHFDGYPAILVQLDRIAAGELEELIVDAWLCQAPKRLAKAYVETHLSGG
ncbi:MAG TPA: MmcQ/YjbR family DNA-binding protein [Solirubrobacteraceae bacterium]|nr:MmcQ/YjbR family DNA-binding protein [Solirubrobacteraceae bacterium]